MIGVDTPPELAELRDRVASFLDEVVLPAEDEIGARSYFDLVAELQGKARAEGLWCPLMPVELGGMGLGHLANAFVQLEVGRSFSRLGAWALNTMAPQDATMLTLLQHGTPAQRERFLQPLIDGDVRVCFAMTEQAAGADATGLQTTATPVDGGWLLRGEKWFISSASISQLAVIMARTADDGPRHERFTAFLAELPDPGFEIVRNVPVIGEELEPRYGDEVVMGHAEVRIDDLFVPDDQVLGGVGRGFATAQHRLGYGRLRHGMWAIAKAQAALDLATARVVERETFGTRLADRQGIQWMLADCAEKLYLSRLSILHLAYKLEHGLDARQENSIAKNYLAHMLLDVIDTAIQIHGALGISHDVPLTRWWAEARPHRIFDGPDEVHRWAVGREVVRAYERDGTTAVATGGDLFR